MSSRIGQMAQRHRWPSAFRAYRAYGLCSTVVSDNSRAFAAADFDAPLRDRGIAPLMSAPFCPSSNGPGEIGVKLVKLHYRRLSPGKYRLTDAVANIHLVPRGDGYSPDARLMGRQPGIFLAKLRPRRDFPVSAQVRCEPGQPVFFRVYPRLKRGERWKPGFVKRAVGSRTFELVSAEGELLMRHVSQVMARRYPSDGEDEEPRKYEDWAEATELDGESPLQLSTDEDNLLRSSEPSATAPAPPSSDGASAAKDGENVSSENRRRTRSAEAKKKKNRRRGGRLVQAQRQRRNALSAGFPRLRPGTRRSQLLRTPFRLHPRPLQCPRRRMTPSSAP